MLKKELDFIWNISLVCPWDCEFCCTDAVNVTRHNDQIIIKSKGLEEIDSFDSNETGEWPKFLNDIGISPNYLDKALSYRQKKGVELNLEEKLQVLKNISSGSEKTHIDFAGGDPLACAENLIVIIEAAKKFGKNNVSITSTGHSLSRYPLNILCNNIGVFEFTYDEPKGCASLNRPRGYNASNLSAAKKLKNMGVYTKCQVPLHSGNLNEDAIRVMVRDLALAGIDEVLLMRTFPVGRGLKYLNSHTQLSKATLLKQISSFSEFSKLYNGPKIRLQCALKHLYESYDENPCDLIRKSFGINFQGLLLLSAWATNQKGDPLASKFVLGNLVKNSFSSISESEKFRRLESRVDENWGHCKIFSFINSDREDENAIFSKADPLYTSKPIDSDQQ